MTRERGERLEYAQRLRDRIEELEREYAEMYATAARLRKLLRGALDSIEEHGKLLDHGYMDERIAAARAALASPKGSEGDSKA